MGEHRKGGGKSPGKGGGHTGKGGSHAGKGCAVLVLGTLAVAATAAYGAAEAVRAIL